MARYVYVNGFLVRVDPSGSTPDPDREGVLKDRPPPPDPGPGGGSTPDPDRGNTPDRPAEDDDSTPGAPPGVDAGAGGGTGSLPSSGGSADGPPDGLVQSIPGDVDGTQYTAHYDSDRNFLGYEEPPLGPQPKPSQDTRWQDSRPTPPPSAEELLDRVFDRRAGDLDEARELYEDNVEGLLTEDGIESYDQERQELLERYRQRARELRTVRTGSGHRGPDRDEVDDLAAEMTRELQELQRQHLGVELDVRDPARPVQGGDRRGGGGGPDGRGRRDGRGDGPGYEGVDGPPAQTLSEDRTSGDVGTPDGALGGYQVVRISGDGAEDSYGLLYDWPSIGGGVSDRKFLYRFDSYQQAVQTLGEDFDYWSTISEGEIIESFQEGDGLYINAGSATEVIGQGGSWKQLVNNMLAQGLQGIGATDPTILGGLYQQSEVMDLIAQYVVGDLTPQWLVGEIRKTDYYTQVVYPGIDEFYGRSANPEQEWNTYYGNIEDVLRAYGFQPDPKRGFRDMVGELLGQGVDDSEVIGFQETWFRTRDAAPYLPILNEWLAEDGLPGLTLDTLFDTFAQTMPDELRSIAEKANIQYAVEQQGFSLSRTQISEFASRAALDAQGYERVANQVGSQLAALGPAGLDQTGYGVDHLLSAAAGLEHGGVGAGDVRRRVQSVARSIAGDDDPVDIGDPRRVFGAYNVAGA